MLRPQVDWNRNVSRIDPALAPSNPGIILISHERRLGSAGTPTRIRSLSAYIRVLEQFHGVRIAEPIGISPER